MTITSIPSPTRERIFLQPPTNKFDEYLARNAATQAEARTFACVSWLRLTMERIAIGKAVDDAAIDVLLHIARTTKDEMAEAIRYVDRLVIALGGELQP